MLGKDTSEERLRMKISVSAHLPALFVWPWCQIEGKLKESGGYLGWHEQLLTENQDPLVTMATLVLPTLCVYSLFVQSSSRWKKEQPGWDLYVDSYIVKDTQIFLTSEWL